MWGYNIGIYDVVGHTFYNENTYFRCLGTRERSVYWLGVGRDCVFLSKLHKGNPSFIYWSFGFRKKYLVIFLLNSISEEPLATYFVGFSALFFILLLFTCQCSLVFPLFFFPFFFLSWFRLSFFSLSFHLLSVFLSLSHCMSFFCC